MTQLKNSILIYDGDCAFCNRSVILLHKLSPHAALHYTPASSKLAKQLIAKYHLASQSESTIILIHLGKAYLRSEAIYKTLQQGGVKGKILSLLFLILPAIVSNMLYNYIAKHRRRLSGGQCPTLPPTLKKRIIMDEIEGESEADTI
jgi:predicted DCC family thiol-disulfide oxidoreductase YuxK